MNADLQEADPWNYGEHLAEFNGIAQKTCKILSTRKQETWSITATKKKGGSLECGD